MKRILPAVYNNPLSLAGAVIVAINVSLIAFVTVVMISAAHGAPYADNGGKEERAADSDTGVHSMSDPMHGSWHALLGKSLAG